MARIDIKKDIEAPLEKVYEILSDLMALPRWNIVVNEISDLGDDKYFLKTNVGDVTNIVKERVPNKIITSDQEGSPMNSIGYILEPKGNGVEVTLWSSFDDESQTPILNIAGELFLKSLKVYVDYVTAGGNPEDYVKDTDKISKA